VQGLPEFQKGDTVLALFPGSSCFYKSTVIRPPSEVIESLFDTSDNEEGISKEAKKIHVGY
jgi:hypothetical protein